MGKVIEAALQDLPKPEKKERKAVQRKYYLTLLMDNDIDAAVAGAIESIAEEYGRRPAEVAKLFIMMVLVAEERLDQAVVEQFKADLAGGNGDE